MEVTADYAWQVGCMGQQEIGVLFVHDVSSVVNSYT